LQLLHIGHELIVPGLRGDRFLPPFEILKFPVEVSLAGFNCGIHLFQLSFIGSD